MWTLVLEPHPLLDVAAFVATFDAELGTLAPDESVSLLGRSGADAPLTTSEEVRSHIRTLLKHGGFKPTGRGKPASEYLSRAQEENRWPIINAAVDIANVVSLHAGLPISVVDLDKIRGEMRIGIAEQGMHYVFNRAGQTIDVGGLVCLFDEEGPCANAVKDAERTKTHAGTKRTLTILWGSRTLGDRTPRATAWCRELFEKRGARVEIVALQTPAAGPAAK